MKHSRGALVLGGILLVVFFVFNNSLHNIEESLESDELIESETYFEEGGNVSEANIWPTRLDDYSPLTKGTVARIIFNDEGKTLLPRNNEFVSPAPKELSPEERSGGVHVVTTFFHGSYVDRRFSEVVASLVANLENPYISFVHVLWEKEDPTQYIERNGPHLLKKLVAIETKSQPTYAKLFTYVNSALDRGAVAIVTNADIYFDSALRCLKGPDPSSDANALSPSQRSVYALSRRHTLLCGRVKADHQGVFDLCEQYKHSHDAFVFAPPVPDRVISQTNHFQNRYGGENIVIYEFTRSKFRVSNPCKKVHAIHLHCSADRHYTRTFIDGYRGNGPNRHGIARPGTYSGIGPNGWKPAPGLECGTQIL